VVVKKTCLKLRLDQPVGFGKLITMGQMNRMLDSGDAFIKAKDRDVVEFDINFLADVHSESSYLTPAQTKPLRFMIFESYIMGGVGTYVVGEVLSGTLMPESNLVAAPGDIECHVRRHS
jgi:translation elongation factor EF-1alpha